MARAPVQKFILVFAKRNQHVSSNILDSVVSAVAPKQIEHTYHTNDPFHEGKERDVHTIHT